jgi:hypothetical protein
MEALLYVLFIAGAIAVAVLSFYLKAKRRKEFTAFAAAHGLRYAREDPFGLVGWPFRLFSRGEGRGIENVVWGTWQGHEIVAYDYWYYERTTDSKGHSHRTYYRFCCAQVDVPAAFPVLELRREGFFTRMADFVGLDDIDFELEEFNRRWNVKAENRRFAYELVDARMIRWLVSLEQRISFEVVGSRLLAYTKKAPPAELIPLIGGLATFRQRIPRVAWGLYPTS